MADADTKPSPESTGTQTSAPSPEPSPAPSAESAGEPSTGSAANDVKAADDRPTADVETPDGRHRRMIVVEKRRGFFGRLLRKILAFLLVVLVLLLLGFVGITLVLRSSIPKDIASSVASGALRLDVALGDVDVGWDGDIDLTDLVVRLPSREGQDQGTKLLEVPAVHAEMGFLPLVAFNAITGGTPMPDRVEVESPTVYMTQDDEGAWSLLRAAELVAAGGGPREPETAPGPISLPPLPNLELTNGTILVRNNAGEESRVEGITVSGTKVSPIVYQASAVLPDVAELEAELIPSNGRKQQAQVRIAGLSELLAPVVPDLPELKAEATWNGGFTSDGGVAGTLTIQDGTRLVGYGLDLGMMGSVGVETTAEGVATLRPAGLTISGLPAGEEGERQAQVLAGTLAAGPEAVMVEELLVGVFGGKLKVDEVAYALGDQTARVRVSFQNLGLADTELSGDVEADLWYGEFGAPMAQLAIVASGEVAGKTIETLSLAVEVAGTNYRDFKTLDIAFSIPESVLIQNGAGETTPLPPVKGTVLVRLADENPYVELASFDAIEAPGTLSAHGRFYLAQEKANKPANYGIWVEGAGWPVTLPRMDEPLAFTIGLTATGEISEEGPGPVSIADLYGSYGDIHLSGGGWYLLSVPEGDPRDADNDGYVDVPLSLALALERNIEDEQAAQRVAEAAREDAQAGEIPPEQAAAAQEMEIAGTIASYLSVWGDPTAVRLYADGELSTADFRVGPYELGDIRTSLKASVIDEVLALHTEGAEVLGAQLTLDASVPFEESQPGEVTLDLTDLELARASEAAALEIAGGPVRGDVDVHLEAALGGFDPANIRAEGRITVDDLVLEPGRVADSAELLPRFEEGRLTMPITLRRDPVGLDDPALQPGARLIDGEWVPPEQAEPHTLELTLNYDVARPNRVVVRDLAADEYPVVLTPEALGGEVTGAAQLSANSEELEIRFGQTAEQTDPQGGIEEPPLNVTGAISAAVTVLTGPTPFDLQPLANLRLSAEADQTRITLDTLEGELVDIGTLTGGGTLELADLPGQSELWVQTNVDLAELADRLNLPEGGAGVVEASVNLRPAPGERPKGEILVDFAFSGTDARWRTVEIDRGQIIAYLSRAPRPDGTPADGPYDFTVITTERIRLLAAGGLIEAYVKYRDRGEANGGRYAQASLDVYDVQLAQLGPVIGKENLQGDLSLLNVVAYGSLEAPPEEFARPGEEPVVENPLPFALNGGGTLRVRHGRLATIDLFQAILEAVNIIPIQTRDEVDADFRLEAGDFRVTGARALVNSVEIRGNLTIRKLFAGEEAPIEGQVIVLAQPLGQFNLPFFAEAQEILDAIQSNATALNIDGRLGRPRVLPTSFEVIGNTIGALLGTGRQ